METGNWVVVAVIHRENKKPLCILDAKLHLSSVWD